MSHRDIKHSYSDDCETIRENLTELRGLVQDCETADTLSQRRKIVLKKMIKHMAYILTKHFGDFLVIIGADLERYSGQQMYRLFDIFNATPDDKIRAQLCFYRAMEAINRISYSESR